MTNSFHVEESPDVTLAIVDDDASVRVAMGRVCSVSGFRSRAFASGLEFLHALTTGARFDCLLLDAHMPEMSGAELQRQLLARQVFIPTIIVTADDSCHLFVEQGSLSAVACLQKPVSIDSLLSAIDLALRPSPELQS